MSINIFEKHPDSKTMEEIIQEINNEKCRQYLSNIIERFFFDENGLEVLSEADFDDTGLIVNIAKDVSICVYTARKTFTLATLQNTEFDNTAGYPLSELGGFVRRANAKKAEESKNMVGRESEDHDDDMIEILEIGIEDTENNAQCVLRFSVREQLRLYPYISINDTLNGNPLKGEELSDYLRKEVLSEEGKGAEMEKTRKNDDSFQAFAVPITFFGDDCTLCFSPNVITIQKGIDELSISPATEFHTILNVMLEFLSESAKKTLSDWQNGCSND